MKPILVLATAVVGLASLAYASSADPAPCGDPALLARLLAAVDHGGAVAIMAFLIIALVAGLALIVVWRLPALARPVGEVIAALRGGPTARERLLERKVAELERLGSQQQAQLEEQAATMARLIAIVKMQSGGAVDLDDIADVFRPEPEPTGA